jgi:hypothetical protein
VRISRSRRNDPDPTLFWRVGLLFLGAGMWFAGVLYGIEWMTLVAIGIVGIGIVLGMAARRRNAGRDFKAEDEPEAEDR